MAVRFHNFCDSPSALHVIALRVARVRVRVGVKVRNYLKNILHLAPCAKRSNVCEL